VPLAVKQALVYEHKQQYPFFARCETAFLASVTIRGTQKLKEGITVQLRK
jgi:hypothetical protein